jgi:hypothetical protein
MRLDAQDLADIRQAITEEGATCLWETKTKTAVDANKPWLGTTSVPVEHSVSITFVDIATAAAMLSQWGKDTEVSSSTLFGLMGNHGFTPGIGERVLRAGKEDLIVKDITEAAPAGVALFYLVEFSA